jgi:hypothetical protein
MRGLGSEADEIALRKAMDLVAKQELDLTEEHVRDLLARVRDHVILEGPPRLERQETRLKGVTLRATEQLVEDTLPSPDRGRTRLSVTDDLHRIDRTVRAIGLGQEVREAESEMVGDPLETAERDATATVLDVGERRG